MIPWWDETWFKEWLELSKRDYHGKREHPPLNYNDCQQEIIRLKWPISGQLSNNNG